MRNALLIILALASMSVAEKPDPHHYESCSATIDKVSLTARFPTQNDPGETIILSVVLRNDSDQSLTYVGYPGAPFFITVTDLLGKVAYHADIGPQDSVPSILAAHSTLSHEYDLSTGLHVSETYVVSIARGRSTSLKTTAGLILGLVV